MIVPHLGCSGKLRACWHSVSLSSTVEAQPEQVLSLPLLRQNLTQLHGLWPLLLAARYGFPGALISSSSSAVSTLFLSLDSDYPVWESVDNAAQVLPNLNYSKLHTNHQSIVKSPEAMGEEQHRRCGCTGSCSHRPAHRWLGALVVFYWLKQWWNSPTPWVTKQPFSGSQCSLL